MVKVSLVDEKEEGGTSPYASSSSSRTSSSLSVSSVGSDLADQESFVDRLTALIDIIPPQTRYSLSSKLSRTRHALTVGGKLLGNVVWIITTSALLVGLPLVLILEDEAKIVNEEKNMIAQQQGAQQMLGLSGSESLDGQKKPQGLLPPGF